MMKTISDKIERILDHVHTPEAIKLIYEIEEEFQSHYNTKFYTAEVFVHRDLENSKREHISISGGRATHQFFELITLKNYKTLYDIVKKIKETYGEPYDNIDGTLYIDVDERAWDDPDCSEHIEVRIYENTKKAVDISEKEPFKCRKCGCEELKDSKQQDETVCLSCEMEEENNDRN